LAGAPGPAFLGAQNRGNRENAPKSPNLGEMANFGVISPISPLFVKGPKVPQVAPRRRPSLIHCLNQSFLRGF